MDTSHIDIKNYLKEKRKTKQKMIERTMNPTEELTDKQNNKKSEQ
jgi:hypothetical protein